MKRKQFAEELVLRENVRKAIKHVLSVRRKDVLDSQRAENQSRGFVKKFKYFVSSGNWL